MKPDIVLINGKKKIKDQVTKFRIDYFCKFMKDKKNIRKFLDILSSNEKLYNFPPGTFSNPKIKYK